MIVKALYDIIIFIPLAAAVSSQIYVFSAAYSVSYRLWLAAAVTAALYIALLKHVRRRERLLMINVLATLLALAVFYHPAGERIDFITGNLWLMHDAGIVLLCAAVFFLSQKLRMIRPSLALAGLMMLPVSLYTGVIQQKSGVIFVFMYALVVLADEIQRRSVKSGDSDPQKHLVFVSPFIIAVFIPAVIFTTPSRPYDWRFVMTASAAIQKEISRIASGITDKGWEGDRPVIGFSGRGGFGGNITGKGYVVLDVRVSEPSDDNLYLSGKVFDSFNGKEWMAENSITEEDMAFDTLETLSAVLDVKGGIPDEEVIKRIRITMVDPDEKSSHVFLPSKVVPGSVGGTETHQASFYRFNMASPVTGQLMKEGHIVTQEGWDRAISKSQMTDAEGYDVGAYQSYKEKQYRQFLPKTDISDRMREYMDEVLSGADTDYEKLKRMEDMLSSFRYTESPGDLPGSIDSPEDYLDYFIFDKKEGYCSYYATAFVLLSRAYGIPARYVQGYRARMGEEVHAEVSSVDTHAWPEAYIEGIGWTAFEPTPGMHVTTTSSWNTKDAYREEYVSAEDTAGTESGTEAADEEPAGSIVIPWSRLVVPLVCGICFAVILFMADHLVRRRRYMMLDEKQKALWLCRRNMQILKRRGFGRNTEETLSEYRARLTDRIRPEFLGFLDAYEILLYSDRDIAVEERKRLEIMLDGLKKAGRRIS